jgi:ABC-type spermidine/putrescine transport system permease subunit II
VEVKLKHYLDVVVEDRLINAFKNSLLLAFTSCFATTTLAFILAYGVNRGGFGGPTSCVTRPWCRWFRHQS